MPAGDLLAGAVLGEPALRLAVGRLDELGRERPGADALHELGQQRGGRSESAAIAPKTWAASGRAGSEGAVSSRLAAIASGASGDHSCQAASERRGVLVRPDQVDARGDRWRRQRLARRARSRRRTALRRSRAAPRRGPARSARSPRRRSRRRARRAPRAALSRGQAVQAAEDAEPAAERQPGDADLGAAAGGERAAVAGERVVDVRRAETRLRSWRPRRRDDTELMGETSMTTPSVDERPAKQWPPLRGATSRPSARA